MFPHRLTKSFVTVVALFLLAISARGEAALRTKGLEGKSDGTFTFHGLPFYVALYDAEFHAVKQSTLKPTTGYPRTDNNGWTLQGEVGAGAASGAFTLTETLQAAGDDAMRVTYHVQKSDKVPFKNISLLIDLPTDSAAGRTLRLDDAGITLPKEPAHNTLAYQSGIRKIVLPTKDGSLVLEGNFTAELQDERQWTGSFFKLHLVITTSGTGDLAFSLRHEPFRTTPISLAQQANRAFRDEVASDNKGGWTDQGPDNDLSPIAAGTLRASDVPFQVIDPASNGNKSCLVLSGDKAELPKSVSIPVPGQPTLANLYLLHAAAWVPSGKTNVGRIHVGYADGSRQSFDVQCQRDVGDWWNITSLPNAVLGWTARNKSSDVGLFVSRFPLNPKPLASVQLESTDPALWMVVGMTGSPDDIPLAADLPMVVHAGPDWVPYELTHRIEPGSVFDFIALNDAPAGKYGHLVANAGGHLEFTGRPGADVRFWGVNLTFGANYVSKEDADRLAEQLARAGYNTVRFHHYDGMLVRAGGSSYDLDPAQWDKLDYLFSVLKKRGIYLNVDLFTIRKFSKAEVSDLDKEISGEIKYLLPISDAAFEAWKKFAANFLTHKNPYTGLTWGEDPALIGICPVNEDPLFITLGEAPASILNLYRDRFTQWTATNNIQTKDDAEKSRAYNRFLVEIQMRSDQRMAEYIRSLKVPTMLTGVNCGTVQALTFLRERYDYVDNHTYLDHPKFLGKSWSLPMLFRQENPLQDRGNVMRGLMADRVFGKPYEVTELHFCWPNKNRSTEGILTAGYASLQDWDAIYNFEYAGTSTGTASSDSGHVFRLVSDPIELLADRAGAVIFRRGDIRTAPGAVAFAVSGASAYAGGWGKPREYPNDFTSLGLVTRIGSVTAAPEAVAGSPVAQRAGIKAVVGEGITSGPGRFAVNSKLRETLAQAQVLPTMPGDGENRFTSETGQIELTAKPGTMKVMTDRCEMFTLPAGQRLDGHLVSVENGDTPGSLYVLSADGKSIAQSDRLLVLFLTDSVYTGTAFRNDRATVVENDGKLPMLVRRGAARVTLRLPESAGGAWQAWTVNANGKRGTTVALTGEGGTKVLPANTVVNGSGCLAWELSRAH